MLIKIEITSGDDDPLPSCKGILKDIIKDILLKSIEYLEIKNLSSKNYLELSVLFVSRNQIRNLNKKYRNKDEETDVLSFPIYEAFELETSKDDPLLLGDIVLSIYSIKENSVYFNVNLNEELLRVIVHSILHLLGQIHNSIDLEDPMINLQEKILKSIMDKQEEWGILCLEN